MTDHTSVTVQVKSTVRRINIVPEYTDRGKFSMTKEFNTKHTADEPDLLDMLGAMTKGQRDMFLLIKVNMDYRTNRAVLGNADLTPSQVNQRSAAYNGLHKLGLIKRVRQGDLTNLAGEKISVSKGTYMVNPTYIRPRDKYAEELFYQWHQLK